MSKCRFDIAWRGRCGKEAGPSDFCDEHLKEKCNSCGEQATHSCDRTGVQFVCGAPLCDGCEGHETPGAGFGYFGFGGHGHRSKQWASQQDQPASKEPQR